MPPPCLTAAPCPGFVSATLVPPGSPWTRGLHVFGFRIEASQGSYSRYRRQQQMLIFSLKCISSDRCRQPLCPPREGLAEPLSPFTPGPGRPARVLLESRRGAASATSGTCRCTPGTSPERCCPAAWPCAAAGTACMPSLGPFLLFSNK